MRRLKFTRDFFIPDNAKPMDCGATDAAVYVYTRASGLYAIAFHGKAQKPDWHHRFRTEEQMAKKIAEFIAGRKATAEFRAKWKAERNKPSTLKVGDVLHASWGYDQTNVDFFQVTRVIGVRTVEARPIAAHSRETGFMSGQCRPDVDNFIGPAKRYRVSDGDSIKTRDFSAYARRCDPAAESYWSSYA